MRSRLKALHREHGEHTAWLGIAANEVADALKEIPRAVLAQRLPDAPSGDNVEAWRRPEPSVRQWGRPHHRYGDPIGGEGPFGREIHACLGCGIERTRDSQMQNLYRWPGDTEWFRGGAAWCNPSDRNAVRPGSLDLGSFVKLDGAPHAVRHFLTAPDAGEGLARCGALGESVRVVAKLSMVTCPECARLGGAVPALRQARPRHAGLPAQGRPGRRDAARIPC